MTNDKEMCDDFEKAGAVYPKVTPEHIEDMLSKVGYKSSLVEGTTTTLVVGVLPVGDVDFTLAVSQMACVDKRNFNAELGVKYCTEKCVSETRAKLWELEGYHLAKTLEAKPDNSTFIERMQTELGDLKAKIKLLLVFFDSYIFSALPVDQQSDLKQQYDIMNAYAAILDKRAKKAVGDL